MSARDRGKRRAHGFTLIELLVVVAIISLLMAMLMPSLQRARLQARTVLCSNSIRNLELVAFIYHAENSNRLFSAIRDTLRPGGFYDQWVSPRYDLRDYLRPYVGSWEITSCPVIGSAPMDDPANQRSVLYWSRHYYPGRQYPKFGAPESFEFPTKLSFPVATAFAPSVLPMIQGVAQDNTLFGGEYLFTHGSGRLSNNPINPSNKLLFNRHLGGLRDVTMGFYDGHVETVPADRLDDVGAGRSDHNIRIISLMP